MGAFIILNNWDGILAWAIIQAFKVSSGMAGYCDEVY